MAGHFDRIGYVIMPNWFGVEARNLKVEELISVP